MTTKSFIAGLSVGVALATVGQGVGDSNQRLPQPKSVENAYPLKSSADREKTTKFCQQLTVDLLASFNNAKQSHWNVNGPLYLPLHELYQEQADFYRGQADVFAERALQVGYSVDGRYGTIAKTSKITEMPGGYQTDNESLKLQLERQTQLQKEAYDGIELLENSDPVTANKLQDLAYMIDKNLWQLRIHLQKPGGRGEDLPYSPAQGPSGAGRN